MIDQRTWPVAKFEFLRFFDFRGEVISLLILVLLAALRFGGEAILNLSSDEPVQIATSIKDTRLIDTGGRFQFEAASAAELEQKKHALQSGRIDGLLLDDGPDGDYRLIVHKSPDWGPDLQELMQGYRRNLRIEAAGLSAAAYEQIDAPVEFDVVYVDPALQPKTASVYGFAIGFIVLSMLGVIGCLSMLVQGISGEKFGHISEMVLTALPAQTWLDGKVIAATLHGLKTILSYAVYTSLAAVVMGFIKVSVLLELAKHSGTLALVVLICFLGLLFWNCFSAFIAATLPSQQSSIRNILPIIPISFLLIALSGAKHPHSGLVEFLSIFPPSAMAAMPVRLLNGAVPAMDLAIALAALAVSVITLRFLTARVFVYAIVSAGSSATIMDYLKFVFRKLEVQDSHQVAISHTD